MKKLLKIVLVAMAFSCAGNIYSQSLSFMNINPDTRSLGNGNISATAEASAFSLWDNSSATVFSGKRFSLGGSYTSWQPDMANNKMLAVGGYANVTKFMAVTVGFRQFSYDSYDITNSVGTVTGSFEPKEMTVGGGFAFKVLPVLSLSADVNMYSSKLGDGFKASGASFNVGATFRSKGLTAAMTVQNIGGDADFSGTKYKLPAVAKAGVAYNLSINSTEHVVRPQAQFGLTLSESSVFGAAGIEYSYNNMVRFGAAYHFADEEKYIPSHLAVGLGASFYGVSLNAAYLIAGSDSALKNSMSVALSYAF